MEITSLLDLSIAHHASDLHLSPYLPPMLRINGDLVALQDQPRLSPHTVTDLLNHLMSEREQQDFKNHLELDFMISTPTKAQFRVNAFHQAQGVAAVFRVIPKAIPTLASLDFPPVLKTVLDYPHGLILVTGATGSGKSTTLAAMIDHINQHRAQHIITLEDPIEFIHTHKKSVINQRQIHRDSHSFASALRSALRQDPDIVLIGEMRDLETIRLALNAAETGHLVFATLHSGSAPRAIHRIVEAFPQGEKNTIRNSLAESIQAVICQTLIKKQAGGRVAAFEIMLGIPAIRHLIREDKMAQMVTTIQTHTHLGMCTLDQYRHELHSKGIIRI